MSSSKISLLEDEMLALWDKHYNWLTENVSDELSLMAINEMKEKRKIEVKGIFNAVKKL